MSGSNDSGFSDEEWEILNVNWEDFEAADREAILEQCRVQVGNEIMDKLLNTPKIETVLTSEDAKERYASICIGMLSGPSEQTLQGVIQCAQSDNDTDVKTIAFQMLGMLSRPTAIRVVPILRNIVVDDQEDTEMRICAYRALVYASGAAADVRTPAADVVVLDDIDWVFVGNRPSKS